MNGCRFELSKQSAPRKLRTNGCMYTVCVYVCCRWTPLPNLCANTITHPNHHEEHPTHPRLSGLVCSLRPPQSNTRHEPPRHQSRPTTTPHHNQPRHSPHPHPHSTQNKPPTHSTQPPRTTHHEPTDPHPQWKTMIGAECFNTPRGPQHHSRGGVSTTTEGSQHPRRKATTHQQHTHRGVSTPPPEP